MKLDVQYDVLGTFTLAVIQYVVFRSVKLGHSWFGGFKELPFGFHSCIKKNGKVNWKLVITRTRLLA